MIKNIFSVLIFLFIFSFIFFIISTYSSDKNKKKINLNRKNVYSNVEDNLSNLPVKNNFKTIPIKAKDQVKEKMSHPSEPPRMIRVKGV